MNELSRETRAVFVPQAIIIVIVFFLDSLWKRTYLKAPKTSSDFCKSAKRKNVAVKNTGKTRKQQLILTVEDLEVGNILYFHLK